MFDNEKSKRIVVGMVFGSMIFLSGRMVLKFVSSSLEADDVFVAFSIQAIRIFDVIGFLAMVILSILLMLSLFDVGNTVTENAERKYQNPESKLINLKKNGLEKTIIHGTASKNKVHGNQYVSYRNRNHSNKTDNDLFDNILESSVMTSVVSDNSRGSSCTHNNGSGSSWDFGGGGDSGSCD
ncbi:hypothetical protein [Bacillus pseudomycoides]|uniref:hypothetical protein n=1 Tax=Bacillus pseudomycoides TaxID=64104 RepID=UPI000BF3C0FD|nr:hypothetical protein [Bacillus pseudomycoides]MDR4188089.1 hypothetical protein [Bacillus pseudomycoides]PFW93915.1 hypothetical protein COL29_12305 [Bacillus pseudomycoides]PGA76484.1 hypothetical protein COL87_01305 [Bacillus pseudomycoides]PGC41229.1 hypothetical protein COM18_11915 [Bacillus pseudomycoides]PHE92344.1 hypothetical protein COF78_17250 [Bacillus pseudomycoides]